MLVELAIRNFAIIDTVRIPFGPGLNVLTGETGAGKSILLDALGAVLGDRVSADMVRSGARSASIDATVSLERLPPDAALLAVLGELNVEPDDDQLILSREIQAGGRSTARLNGRPTTAAILAQIGAHAVDIHGQSEHLSLLRPAAQLELLDRFAHVAPERESFAQRYRAWRQARIVVQESHAGARERMLRIDQLRFQIDEITGAALRAGEEEELIAERGRLAHAERLAVDAAAAYEAIAGDDLQGAAGGALPALRLGEGLLANMSELDQSIAPLGERLSELRYLLEDIAADARRYRDEIEVNPPRLAAVEERLSAVRQLQRKYGADIAAILSFGQSAEVELERLTGSESDAGLLAEREAVLANEVGGLAAKLSARRKDSADALAEGVEQAIAQLNMGAALFTVALEQSDDPNGVPVANSAAERATIAVDATGIDRVSFLIAPNPGEGLKPLSRIASGGETARLMLALKSVLSEADQTPTLVFDEIDVGVGGRSGQVVGEKLWELAESHQVIVITHLPQIAAFADNHFRIAKVETGGRVSTEVAELRDDDRLEELAAMLDGLPVTSSSRQSARELLQRAMTSKQAQVTGVE